jgi:hypothetical protein
VANHICVFCRSAELLSLKDIGNYIEEGALLDEDPQFTPRLDSSDASASDWTYLEIVYRPDKRPVQLHRLIGAERMAPMIEDALRALSDHAILEKHPELVERLRSCRQIFHFELGWELTDDCWEMLDATEAYIARKRDGVVFASEGFYNKDLQPIHIWN